MKSGRDKERNRARGKNNTSFFNQPMTNYNLKAIVPPSLLAKLKKEARRRVLEAVRERREKIYKRYFKKRQLQTVNDT